MSIDLKNPSEVPALRDRMIREYVADATRGDPGDRRRATLIGELYIVTFRLRECGHAHAPEVAELEVLRQLIVTNPHNWLFHYERSALLPA